MTTSPAGPTATQLHQRAIPCDHQYWLSPDGMRCTKCHLTVSDIAALKRTDMERVAWAHAAAVEQLHSPKKGRR